MADRTTLDDRQPLPAERRLAVRGLALRLVTWHPILGATVRDRRQPLLAFARPLGLRALGVVVLQQVADRDAITPNQKAVLRSPGWADCHPQGMCHRGTGQLDRFLAQPGARGYPRFDLSNHSADPRAPIVDREMRRHRFRNEGASAPGQGARILLWFLGAQIALGWALTLLAVAGFSGLIKTDNTS